MKGDSIAIRIEVFEAAKGVIVGWYEQKGAYHPYLLTTESADRSPQARHDVRLGYGSHRQKREDIDDMGGSVLPLDQALDYTTKKIVLWTRT